MLANTFSQTNVSFFTSLSESSRTKQKQMAKSKVSLCRLKMKLCPMSFSVSLFSGNAKPDGHYFIMPHGYMHKEDRCEPHDHCYLIDPSAKVYSVLDACSVSLD